MGIKFTNNAKTTITASITSGDTSVSVATGSLLPSLSAGDYFYATLEDTSLNREVVKVTARSGNNLTIVRAQDSTTARAFTSGDKLELRVTAASLADLASGLTLLGTASTWSARQTYDNALFPTLIVTNSAGGGSLRLDGLTGFQKGIDFTVSGVNRWLIYCSSDAESTGNAGSNFTIRSRTDAGAALRTDLTITRSTGAWAIPGLVNLNGGAYSLTLDLGHASDTTMSRKSAGVVQVETKQLATVGPKVYRASQYCVGDGSTDDYTAFAAMQTLASAAGAVMIVDCLVRLGTSLTITVPLIVEGGGFSVDSGRVLTISASFAAGRFKVFQGSGTVTWGGKVSEVYPEWWGVNGTVSSSANLTAINALHASLAAGGVGAVVKWAQGQYTFSGSWTAITTNNVAHIGAGMATLGTWFIFENTTGDDITFSGCQHPRIEDINFTYFARKTAGYVLVISGCYRARVISTNIQYAYNGIEVINSTETVVLNPEFQHMLGTRGLYYTGSVGVGSYRLVINNMVANNAYVNYGAGLPQMKGNWATSTAYAQYDIVVANGKVWQCTVAGTSAGSGGGPNALPGTTASEAFSNSVTDNTVTWRFIMTVGLAWLVQDNYAYSLSAKQLALINGDYGFRMMDTANTGSSYPIWAYIDCIDTDHAYTNGIYAEAGEGLYVDKGWQGSTLDGEGVKIGTGFKGEVTYTDGRVMGNAKDGISIGAPDVTVDTTKVGSNGWKTNNTYSGITVLANVDDFTITNNTSGRLVSLLGSYSKYGIEIKSGTSDHYVVTGNRLRGNVTGTISDGGSGANKTVSGNVN